MRAVLALLLATIAVVSAQPAKPQKAKAPKYYTAQEIKVYWYNKIPIPSTMAPGRAKAIRARQLFVEDVRAGRYDLLAERTAAAHNLTTATNAQDFERAKIYEASLARLDKAIADEESKQVAIEAARAAEFRDAQLLAEMENIKKRINTLNGEIQQARMESNRD